MLPHVVPYPDMNLLERVVREISFVRAEVPYLPPIGVAAQLESTFNYAFDTYSRTYWIKTPMPPYNPDDITLRRAIRHECGHCLAQVWGERRPGLNIFAALDVDPEGPQPTEVVAEIVGRWLGNAPLYPPLEPYSRVTPARADWLIRSGDVPDNLEEEIIAKHQMDMYTNLPGWVEPYRRWMELKVQRWLGLSR